MVQSSCAKSLYLHIGHNKTGSSYVQSSLACSIDKLLDQGIVYPESINIERAAKGEITNGTFDSFLKVLKNDEFLSPNCQNRFLFSSEILFQSFVDEVFQESFREFINKNDIASVKVLLFLRDPVSHACSSYQQLTKRAGFDKPIKALPFENFDVPRNVNNVLDFLESLQQINVTVKNYSREKNHIISVVEEWLELPSGTLRIPKTRIVNRSLTFSELELQRFVNVDLGSSGNVLADHLCNNLPDISSDEVRPSIAIQENLWDNLMPEIGKVNARVAPEAKYDRDRDITDPKQYDDDLFVFSQAQLEVIASCIVRPVQEVARYRSQVTDLHQRLEAQVERAKSREADFSALQQRLEAQIERSRNREADFSALQQRLESQMERSKNREADFFELQKRLKAHIERATENEKMIAKMKAELFELRNQINTCPK